MKRQTFNVLFFIRKTRTVKSGETPIMLRITIQGQLAEMQLKRTVKPELWSQAKERCTGKDSKSVEVNRYLESIKLRLYEIHRTLEDENKLINPMEIKRRFLGLDEKHKMFFEVFHPLLFKMIWAEYECNVNNKKHHKCIQQSVLIYYFISCSLL